MKKCKWCGKEFRAIFKNEKYCGFHKYSLCVLCKKKFRIENHHNLNKYCSVKCVAISRIKVKFVEKFCLACGIKMDRKKKKSKKVKRGWLWETNGEYANRKTCSLACNAKLGNKKMGNRLWTEKKVLDEFNKIKNDNKYKGSWLRKNYSKLYS